MLTFSLADSNCVLYQSIHQLFVSLGEFVRNYCPEV